MTHLLLLRLLRLRLLRRSRAEGCLLAWSGLGLGLGLGSGLGLGLGLWLGLESGLEGRLLAWAQRTCDEAWGGPNKQPRRTW